METITERIKALIDLNGDTVNSFAMKVGINPGNLNKKIKGQQPVTDRDIRIIATKEGIRREWLRHGTGDMKEKAVTLPSSVTQLNDHVQGDAYNVNNGTECAALMKEVEMLRQENAWLRSLVEKKLQINN